MGGEFIQEQIVYNGGIKNKRTHRQAFGGADNCWTQTLLRQERQKRKDLRDQIKFQHEIYSQPEDGDDEDDDSMNADGENSSGGTNHDGRGTTEDTTATILGVGCLQ